MVYCARCGAFNPDAATNCSNCGVNLFTGQNRPYMGYEHRRNYDERYQYRRTGAGVGLLIAGLFIIIIGLAALTGFTAFWSFFWPLLLILIGLWVLMLGLRRNRRYRQAPTI